VAERIETIDEYLAPFPEEVRAILQQVHQALRRAMPDATESIRYGMPALMLQGRYGIHFAGWKSHVGLYPVPVLSEELERDVAPYRSAKDTVRFRYARPVRYDLIERLAAEIARRPDG